MSYTFRYENPKLGGVIVREAVKCGKPNCRCAKGELHKWYYYLYWRDYRDRGQLKKNYIGKEEVNKLRRRIKQAKSRDEQIKVDFQKNLFLLKLTKLHLKGEIDESYFDQLKKIFI